MGVIIDGNRRWAKEQGLLAKDGHRKGIDLLKEFARWSFDEGVECVIAYVFSTENWKRSKIEVDNLMKFLRSLIKSKIDEAIEENIRLRIIGQKERFAEDIQELFHEAEEKTKYCTQGTLALGLSYGGRAELVDACKKAITEIDSTQLDTLTEDSFSKLLWTNELPDPDMIIRTGGEKRLSNFLPWQSTYSELFFVDTYWPAFSKEEFFGILQQFARRNRRRGQ